MKENFEQSLAYVLEHEGGYVDHPDDPGGCTNMGITRATLEAWRGRSTSCADVKALTVDEAGEIYKANYWDAVRGDELPGGVDYAMFDFAVNSGPKEAIRYLQVCLRVDSDGVLGNQTMAAIEAAAPGELVKALHFARLARFRGRDGWSTFGTGWQNRMWGQPGQPGVTERAVEMAGTGPGEGEGGGEEKPPVPEVELPVPVETWQSWDADRQCAALGQQYMADSGIDPGPIDGLVGAQTQQALAAFEHVALHGEWPPNWRDEDNRPPPDHTEASLKWPKQTPESELYAFYGDRGSNQVLLTSPYELRLYEPNGQPYQAFNIHQECHDSCMRVLEEVLRVYGYDEIVRLRLHVFSGCFNNRKMTGSSRWSTHAWACSIDWNAPENQYKWDHTRALFAKPEYKPWWDAWAREGWTGLGPARDYDWMHVQAARL